MMKKRFVPAIVVLLLATPAVFAQTKTYSLPDVWQAVLHHYPSLKAKKEAIEIQELQKELIRQGFLPNVAVQAQQTYGSAQNLPGSFFPLPGIYTTTGSNKPSDVGAAGANLNTSALVQWNFLEFGRQQKKMTAADAAIQVSNRLLKQEEWNLLSAATRLYFSTLASSAALEVAKADTRRFSGLLELVQAQASAGLRPGADTLLLKASLLQSKAAEHDYLSTIRTRRVQLGALMGDSSATFSVDTTLFHRFQPTTVGT
ncbi:MAG: hypothetical protein EOO10_22620, partial [Chitinophagaceae bacterium]